MFGIWALALQRHAQNTLFHQNVQGQSKRWDKQVYDMVADDYGILWIIVSEQLNFTWNTGTVIRASLAIVYFTDQFLH